MIFGYSATPAVLYADGVQHTGVSAFFNRRFCQSAPCRLETAYLFFQVLQHLFCCVTQHSSGMVLLLWCSAWYGFFALYCCTSSWVVRLAATCGRDVAVLKKGCMFVLVESDIALLFSVTFL